MIRLITGLPGSGKSLRSVMLIKQYLAEGRAVYVDGIDDLEPFGWEPCNASEWANLPDGSVVVCDEAQKRFPSRRMGDPPCFIRELSEHRHRGFDFVLVTQHPTMLDKYVRTLVGEHVHVIRQFGMPASRLITWMECQDDPQSLGTRQRGTESLWKYPTDLYGLYKSATVHTVKRRIPFRIAVLPVVLIAAIVATWYGVHSLGGITKSWGATEPGKAGPAPAGGGTASRSSTQAGSFAPATAADYARHFAPRIASEPWSAPWHDGVKPVAEPELLCVVSEARGCKCFTEQITPYRVPEADCQRNARNGVYNPFKAPIRAVAASPSTEDRRGSDEGRRSSPPATQRHDQDAVPRITPRDRRIGIPPPPSVASIVEVQPSTLR